MGQLNNCLAEYNLAQCRRHILVKLDGDDGIPLAVGSFVNGEWEAVRYANNRDARGAVATELAPAAVQQLYLLRTKMTSLANSTPSRQRFKLFWANGSFDKRKLQTRLQTSNHMFADLWCG